MTVTQDLEQQVLDYCNAVRTLFNQPPLSAMPQGDCGNDETCPVHRALENIGLGRFRVDEATLLVPRAFGESIATALGSSYYYRAKDLSTTGAWPARVMWPEAVQTFIHLVDEGEYPHLATPQRTLEGASA